LHFGVLDASAGFVEDHRVVDHHARHGSGAWLRVVSIGVTVAGLGEFSYHMWDFNVN